VTPEHGPSRENTVETGIPSDHSAGVPPETRLYRLPVVALDFETTGLAAYRGDAVCEVALVSAEGEQVETLLSTLVDPGRPLSAKTRELTGIRDDDLRGAPCMRDVIPEMVRLVGATPIVMHNAPFDLHFLQDALAVAGRPPCSNLAIDTLLMARFLDRNRLGNSLRQTAERYGIPRGRAHRALDDARVTALAYHALVPYLELRGVRSVGDLVRGRMAGPAGLFVERPSSMLLDLATRVAGSGTVVDLLYSVRPGGVGIERRFRPDRLEDEKFLIGWDLDVEEQRTYRLDRILILGDGQTTYLSPWVVPEDIPMKFRR
jgi:DNA polymerase III epsilon subunit family exonuclease